MLGNSTALGLCQEQQSIPLEVTKARNYTAEMFDCQQCTTVDQHKGKQHAKNMLYEKSKMGEAGTGMVIDQ